MVRVFVFDPHMKKLDTTVKYFDAVGHLTDPDYLYALFIDRVHTESQPRLYNYRGEFLVVVVASYP